MSDIHPKTNTGLCLTSPKTFDMNKAEYSASAHTPTQQVATLLSLTNVACLTYYYGNPIIF